MDSSGSALDIGFIYEAPYDRALPDGLERQVKFALLFFDKVAIKLTRETEDDSPTYEYLLRPLQDEGLLEIVMPEEIMTPDALKMQNSTILDLVQSGIFDYLKNPEWDTFKSIGRYPLQYYERAVGEHRAFLAPVAEELIRRKLAFLYGAEFPEELLRRAEQHRMRKQGGWGDWLPDDLSSSATQSHAAFPLYEHGRDLIEFDGETFIRLAVHKDVAFLHEEIVRIIAYSSSKPGKQYHPFTHLADRSTARQFLQRLPGSAYAEVVATDLEQITVDLDHVPLDDLLAFRSAHRPRLIEYRVGLASTVQEISLCKDAREREALLLRRQEECASLASELKHACRQIFGIKLGAAALGAIGMAWSLGHGDAVQAMLSAASAAVGIKATTEPYSHIRYLYEIQGFSY